MSGVVIPEVDFLGYRFIQFETASCFLPSYVIDTRYDGGSSSGKSG